MCMKQDDESKRCNWLSREIIWQNIKAFFSIFFKAIFYYCCSFSGVTVDQYKKIMRIRKAIACLFALSAAAQIYIICGKHFRRLDEEKTIESIDYMYSLVVIFGSSAICCLCCCVFNCFELKKHIHEVYETKVNGGEGVKNGVNQRKTVVLKKETDDPQIVPPLPQPQLTKTSTLGRNTFRKKLKKLSVSWHENVKLPSESSCANKKSENEVPLLRADHPFQKTMKKKIKINKTEAMAEQEQEPVPESGPGSKLVYKSSLV